VVRVRTVTAPRSYERMLAALDLVLRTDTSHRKQLSAPQTTSEEGSDGASTGDSL